MAGLTEPSRSSEDGSIMFNGRNRTRRGFTLIELLIVVGIIGILAAIAVPNLLAAVQRAKQKRSMTDIRTIANAWERRAIDLSSYNLASWSPLTEVDYKDLWVAVVPTYIETLPVHDAWGHDWKVYSDQAWTAAAPASSYQVVSPGRNGTLETSTPFGPTTSYDCDIVWQDGSFLVWPEGPQGAI